jgi:tetratricopeptide (TPR) repeat protein
MAKGIGAMFVEGMAFTAYGTSCYYKGLFDEAETSLLKGLDFSERTAQVFWGPWAAFSLGDMYFDLGKHEKAKDYYQRGLSILEPGKMLPSWMKLFEVAVARAKVLEGDRDLDLSELVRYHRSNKLKVFQVWMARYITEILLNIGEENTSDAEDWIKKAIDIDKRNGMSWFLARDYVLYAELFKRKGMPPKAKEKLKEARDIFKECGADGWLKKVEGELAAPS